MKPAPKNKAEPKGLMATLGVPNGAALDKQLASLPKTSGPLASGGKGVGPVNTGGLATGINVNDTTTSDDFVPRSPRTPGAISKIIQKAAEMSTANDKKKAAGESVNSLAKLAEQIKSKAATAPATAKPIGPLAKAVEQIKSKANPAPAVSKPVDTGPKKDLIKQAPVVAGSNPGLNEPGMNAPINPKKFGPSIGKPINMSAPATKPNPAMMKKGGKVKSTSGYKSGGSVSGASKRGDGIAQRGKTRGKIC